MPPAALADVLHKPGGKTFLNTKLMTADVFEIGIPPPVIAEIAPHIEQVRRLEVTGTTASLANGVRLYVEQPRTWRSDIRWLSHADERSYRWFEGMFDRLALASLAAPLIPHDRAIRLYAGFFVTRSRCTATDFHTDWLTDGNHALTLMAPVTDNATAMGLAYEDVRGAHREYTYRLGTGIVFGAGFAHSTAVGELDERAVFLCLNFGTDRLEQWPEIARTTGTQSPFFRQPDGTFIDRETWRQSPAGTPRY